MKQYCKLLSYIRLDFDFPDHLDVVMNYQRVLMPMVDLVFL
jgi:hypothetical protein